MQRGVTPVTRKLPLNVSRSPDRVLFNELLQLTRQPTHLCRKRLGDRLLSGLHTETWMEKVSRSEVTHPDPNGGETPRSPMVQSAEQHAQIRYGTVRCGLPVPLWL